MITLPIEHKDIQALHYQLLNKDIKVISCVGITERVGTTSIAYALARRFSASGAKTLLIDLDRVGYKLSTQLACPNQDWTPETIGKINAVNRMGRTGLSVLSAPSATSLHWSFKERSLLQKMLSDFKREYDVIVIDTGSIIQTKEKTIPAEIISSVSDICIPIILSGKTNETDVIKAQKVLNDHGTNVQGMIMNDYKNPPLSEEIARTLRRLTFLRPKYIERWSEKIERVSFLSQRL